jgi:hypothetical protein
MTIKNRAELADDLWILNCDVFLLHRPVGVIVEFDGGSTVRFIRSLPDNQPVSLGANRTTETLFLKTVIGVVIHTGAGILEHGDEAHTVDWLGTGGSGQSGEFGESGIDIHCFSDLASGRAGFGHTGTGDDERDAVRQLVVHVLGPHPELT